MKKITAMILIAMLLLGALACGSNNQSTSGQADSTGAAVESSTEPASESAVKGAMHDFGRFSALVPEGWEVADIGDFQADYNGVIVKGKGEDFMTAPTASLVYMLPSEVFMSGRGFYDNVRTEEDFELGGRTWEIWTGEYEGGEVAAAESEGEDGAITVMLNMPEETDEKLSLEDPDIRALLESIVVVPIIEVDWITLKDGIAEAELPEVEGYEWDGSGELSINNITVSVSLKGNKLTLTPESGTGAFNQALLLLNDDGSLIKGEAAISIRVTDGKADALYEGSMKIYDEPKEKEESDDDYEEDVDFEELAEMFGGTWIDANNDLTLFIQTKDEEEESFMISIQSDNIQISAEAVCQDDQSLVYEEITLNGNTVESSGYFAPDGDLLIWGHDEAVGEFEYITVFSKTE